MFDHAAKAKIIVHPVRRNIYVLEGSGGNIAALAGTEGVLLIDSGLAVSEGQVEAALDSLSSERITTLINSHWHFDHTDGNAWVHRAGAEIIAHVNTKRRLSAATRVDAWNWTFPPALSDALPTTTFETTYQVVQNDTHVALTYYGPAHTDTDVSVSFEEANVLLVGDTWWNGMFPFIDYSTGGSIEGMIHASELNLSMVGNDTIIIPGHGPVGYKAELSAYRDMLIGVRNQISNCKERGKSLEETLAEHPTANYDLQFGQSIITPAFFTSLVYSGV